MQNCNYYITMDFGSEEKRRGLAAKFSQNRKYAGYKALLDKGELKVESTRCFLCKDGYYESQNGTKCLEGKQLT